MLHAGRTAVLSGDAARGAAVLQWEMLQRWVRVSTRVLLGKDHGSSRVAPDVKYSEWHPGISKEGPLWTGVPWATHLLGATKPGEEQTTLR